jgi:hypothetical protein
MEILSTYLSILLADLQVRTLTIDNFECLCFFHDDIYLFILLCNSHVDMLFTYFCLIINTDSEVYDIQLTLIFILYLGLTHLMKKSSIISIIVKIHILDILGVTSINFIFNCLRSNIFK